MNWWMLIIFCILAGIVGISFGLFYAKSLAKRFRDALLSMDSSERLLKNAQWRREAAINAASNATKEYLDAEAQRLEEERDVVRRIQTKIEQELDQKQSTLDKRANELTARDEQLIAKGNLVLEASQKITEIEASEKEVIKEYEQLLITRANVQRSEFLQQMHNEMLHLEKLSISKFTMDSFEELKLEASRIAKEMLNAVTLRYNPKFLWPKIGFNVHIPFKAFAEEHYSRNSKILHALTDGLGIETDLIIENETEPPYIKLSGGSGVEKEVIRSTLEEVIGKRELNIEKILETRERFRKQLDKLTLKFGEEAQKKLGLTGLHPEILKLIGALNYRTSHRQNQYYHSMEVSCLAGMLASEIGIDANLAKRAGLLHDIGKALDYKIEGSHAVISADFAAKHGESEEVVDIILSHHDDKILETPHAYVLKAADAMSGARPGARVEMEEGYQKRIEAIQQVIESFADQGVASSAIMNAGRDVHVFVNSKKVKENYTEPLTSAIVKKLETDVQYPGQIRVTVVRRTEVVEVA